MLRQRARSYVAWQAEYPADPAGTPRIRGAPGQPKRGIRVAGPPHSEREADRLTRNESRGHGAAGTAGREAAAAPPWGP